MLRVALLLPVKSTIFAVCLADNSNLVQPRRNCSFEGSKSRTIGSWNGGAETSSPIEQATHTNHWKMCSALLYRAPLSMSRWSAFLGCWQSRAEYRELPCGTGQATLGLLQQQIRHLLGFLNTLGFEILQIFLNKIFGWHCHVKDNSSFYINYRKLTARFLFFNF